MNLPAVMMVVVGVVSSKVTMEPVKCKKCQVRTTSRQTSALKLKFYILIEVVIKRFIQTKVDTADVLASLPTKIASELRSQGATTIKDIFRETGPLDKALKWYSFNVLVTLVRRFGDEKCKQELRNYTDSLQQYLQTRLALICDKTIIFNSTTQQSTDTGEETFQDTTVIVTDPEWDKDLVESKEECDYIASLLGTTSNRLQFAHV